MNATPWPLVFVLVVAAIIVMLLLIYVLAKPERYTHRDTDRRSCNACGQLQGIRTMFCENREDFVQEWTQIGPIMDRTCQCHRDCHDQIRST